MTNLGAMGATTGGGALILALGFLAASCEPGPPSETSEPAGPVPLAAAESEAARPRIVVLGDSLTAGWGLAPEQAFPALLSERLGREGFRFEVVNAGLSGDTTAGGLRRVDWVLGDDVRVLILALGANDGLRGLPVAELKSNLARIIERAKARGATVLLAGMEAPPNLGTAYTRAFREVFAELAREQDIALVPFLLRDVAGVASLNQPDGVHPTAQGQRLIAENLWPHLRPLLPADHSHD